MAIFKNKWLTLILAVAAILRLWGLAINPPHLTNDEAALGYNAYSIFKTGRDEHGQFLPIVFKSFGDWKPGLYVYLDVPFVAALGLNEFSVRLPSALAGIFAVFLIYLVVLELFRNQKLITDNWQLATIASALLAISPWHLQFSRGAWEANVAFTFVLAGIYFFLEAVNEKKNWLVWSAIFFALTLLTYQGAKLSTAIVVVGLALIYRNQLFKLSRTLLVKSFILGFIVTSPIIVSLIQGKVGRLEIYSIFSYGRSEEIVAEIIGQENVTRNSWQYVIYHSEPLNFARGILGRWFNHYSGRFLFFEGDWSNPRHGVPNAGVLLAADAVLLVAGFIFLARLGGEKQAMFLWYLLLLTPLPAVLSRDSIHAIRSLNMVIPLTVVLALGATSLWERVKNFRWGSFLVFLFLAFYVANFIYYLDQYWIHAPRKNSQYWQYGYKQMVEKVTVLQDKYRQIVVKQDYSQPYIFFLFYQKYDPAKYQKMAGDVFIPSQFGDVGLVSKLENVTFRDINWQVDRGLVGTLFMVDPIKIPLEDSSDPNHFKIVDEIKFLNGQTAFRLIEILK